MSYLVINLADRFFVAESLRPKKVTKYNDNTVL